MQRFQWKKTSKVIGPSGVVLRPDPTNHAHVMAIAARPAAACLQKVAAGFQAGNEFCIQPTLIKKVPSEIGMKGYFQCLTSGSSSKPKRLRRHQNSWIRSFEVNADLWQITTRDRYAVLGALSHSLALYGCLEALFLGADLLLLSDLRPDRQAQSLERDAATILYATPTQLRLLCNNASGPLTPMRKIIVGGAALDEITKTALQTLCPNADIIAFYGAAETSFISLTDATTPTGSVGRPYRDVALSICNPDGVRVAAKTSGELWVRSPYLFHGYCGYQPGVAHWKDGWINIGEIGYLDPSGYLFLTGRKSRMFTVADQNIFPEEIERWYQSKGINPVAVLPRPDVRLGHVPVLITEVGQLQEGQLSSLNNGLAMHARPRVVLQIKHWPLLTSGKTDLQALAALVSSKT